MAPVRDALFVSGARNRHLSKPVWLIASPQALGKKALDRVATRTARVLLQTQEGRGSPDILKANEEAAEVIPHIPHGKLVHIDGAAHNLHHDQRKRTVVELEIFLKTI